MNYTEKYHLPQWEETDRILRTDFNRMCADMEAGLNKTAADAAADTAAAKQENAYKISQAQSTANTAVSKANAAQATADNAYCPGKYPYRVGSYVGTGEVAVERHIELGFAPRFVLITFHVTDDSIMQAMGAVGVVSPHPIMVTDTGFNIVQHRGWPEVNREGTTYVYIAFP